MRYQSFNKRRKKPYAIKKTSIKDENIDRQIIAIHHAIAKKLLADTHCVQKVKNKLEQQLDEKKIRYSHFINWYSILEMIDQPEVFLNAMIEDTPQMRRLRRNTPFVGILTEQEREVAIKQDASGVMSTVEILF
ncbi:hypothetical protein [Thalassotalea euphylliae]|uniref:Uncharacterized protein n=1 Tax=Thalassotalea euphylliae TaxID=1655234 RepID=A0A3E0UFE2_9GAMM|nr:hypothetical protein [Thalassotalea euphylliae]REL35570.1 hypothetical protein DXX92_09515 [Thalassotalea euphylliae]